MKIPVIALSFLLLASTSSVAVETASRLTGLEIVERLTRLEEGQNALRNEIHILREDMNRQSQQLRTDMNAQFDQVFHLILGVLGAFAAMVTLTIGFAVWDRRTTIRPFEPKVKIIEDDMAHDHQKLHSILDALRALGRSDEKVAAVLKQFNVL